MSIDPSGVPFVLGPLVPAAGLAWLGRPGWAVSFVVLSVCLAGFFRDPERHPPADRHAVLAPADGRVMIAGPASGAAPPGDWLQVAIFLSPLDVHINRAPVPGRVVKVQRHAGAFVPAYRHDADKNARTEVWIDRNGQTVVYRQIVGVLARRIVSRVAEGQVLGAGERVGLMRFGSRMDVFMPVTARLQVQPGDRVRGGESILATLA
jgi:phosphatidylserine decarboxylase